MALGYTLVYGIIELINFAHGDVFMLGSMLAFLLIGPIFAVTADTPVLLKIGIILLVLGVTMIGTAALNVSIERVAYKPLRNAPKLAPLISAIGMSFVLQNVGLLLAGPGNKSIDNIFGTTNILSIFGVDGRHDQHPADLRRDRDHPAPSRAVVVRQRPHVRARRCARPRRTPTPPG